MSDEISFRIRLADFLGENCYDFTGFGGGEATRDPAPTVVDPNDPKGKQQAIHKAESFADYLARRKAER